MYKKNAIITVYQCSPDIAISEFRVKSHSAVQGKHLKYEHKEIEDSSYHDLDSCHIPSRFYVLIMDRK